MTNSSKLSQAFPALNNPNRITKKETYINSFLASLQDPNQNMLVKSINTPLISNYWVPETTSKECKTGSRELDGIRYIVKKQKNSSKASSTRHIVIYEYKIGVLTLEHITDTLYVKDYINCVINGTNKKVRSKDTPLRNLFKQIKCKLLRLPKVDEITVLMLADRISNQAAEYADKINKANKYVHRVSTGQNIPVNIMVRTYKDYILTLENKYGIQWNHTNNLNQQLLNMSDYPAINAFPKWDQNGKLIGYWKPNELQGF